MPDQRGFVFDQSLDVGDSVVKNAIENRVNMLSLEARQILAEIIDNEQVAVNHYKLREGLDELIEENVVNVWSDDTGTKYAQFGEQL